MRTHNANPRARKEKKTISLHGHGDNQIMTKGIERQGQELELPEIVGVPDNLAAPFKSASSAVC